MVIITRYSVDDPVFFYTKDGTVKESTVHAIICTVRRGIKMQDLFGFLGNLFRQMSAVSNGQKPDMEKLTTVETDLRYMITDLEDAMYEVDLFESMDEALENHKSVKR